MGTSKVKGDVHDQQFCPIFFLVSGFTADGLTDSDPAWNHSIPKTLIDKWVSDGAGLSEYPADILAIMERSYSGQRNSAEVRYCLVIS